MAAPALRGARPIRLLLFLLLLLPFPAAPLAPPLDVGRCLNSCGYNETPARGFCVGGRVPRCACADDWSGGAADCSERVCPSGPAWWDAPLDALTAHTTVLECSGVGACDRATGRCACGVGFEGAACERSACPGLVDGTPCSGRGRCLPMAAAAVAAGGAYAPRYEGWDAGRVQGCVCDAGWDGAACESRVCPLGDNPSAKPHAEVHVVATAFNGEGALAPDREVQLLSFGATGSGGTGSGGGADVDEVQRLTMAGHGGIMPSGEFRVCLNATVESGGCRLWLEAQRVYGCTGPVAVAQNEDADAVGERLLTALGALPSIGGVDQLLIRSTLLNTGPPDNWVGYLWDVTFSGPRVGGDVTLMEVNVTAMYPPVTWLLLRGWDEVAKGSEVVGPWAVAYNDTAAFSLAARGAAPDCGNATGEDGVAWARWAASGPLGTALATIDPTAPVAATERALSELLLGCPRGALASGYGNGSAWCGEAPPGGGAPLSVEKVPNGGPSVSLRVRFLRGLRARGPLSRVTPLPSHPATTAALTFGTFVVLDAALSANTTREVAGTAVEGDWTLMLPVPDALGRWGASRAAVGPLGPFPWCASAEFVRTALQAAEDAGGLGLGTFVVSRTRTYAPGATNGEGWGRTYAWSVTFASLAERVGALLEAAPLSNVAEEAWAVDDGGGVWGGDAAAPTLRYNPTALVVRRTAAGTPANAVNEVQLLNCVCPPALCGARGSSFRLTFGSATTAALPWSATASALRAALAALPGVPDVRVAAYGAGVAGVADPPLCSDAGVTTGVTFTHNPGPQPLLQLRPEHVLRWPLREYAPLSVSGAPGVGVFGGRARRGRRALVPCSGQGTCNGKGRCECQMDARGAMAFGPSDGGGGAEAAAGGGDALSAPAAGPPPVAGDGGLRFFKLAANCGRRVQWPASAATGGCPMGCFAAAAQGACSGAPAWRCDCSPGWTGRDCNTRACPVAQASFFSLARRSEEWRGPVESHGPAPCGGAGTCTGGGACVCVGGWSGAACGRGPCPGGGASSCATGAPCVTLRALTRGWALEVDAATGAVGVGAAVAAGGAPPPYEYTAWDADLLRGCVCGSGAPAFNGGMALNWQLRGDGHACELRRCRWGADPLAARGAGAAARPPAAPAVQRLVCTLTAGAVALRFAGAVAAPPLKPWATVFDMDATPEAWEQGGGSLEMALRSMPGARPFSLALEVLQDASPWDPSAGVEWVAAERARDPAAAAAARRLCSGNGTSAARVTFLGAPPAVPLLRGEPSPDAVGALTVAPVAESTLVALECSGRGVCDRALGQCRCGPQFMSSDGAGGEGQTGDCGAESVLVGLQRVLPTPLPGYTPRTPGVQRT